MVGAFRYEPNSTDSAAHPAHDVDLGVYLQFEEISLKLPWAPLSACATPFGEAKSDPFPI